MTAEESDEPVVIPITGELDLHTFRPGEVNRLLEDYFVACRKRGIHRIRVVHGKGNGTLRATVLAHLRRSPEVARFAQGDETSGGWGATIVTLFSGRSQSEQDLNHSSRRPAVRHSTIELPGRRPQSPGMSTKFIYALTLTICGALLNLLLFFTGYQTEKLATGQYFQWLGFVIMFVVLWLGIKAVREESPQKAMTYGKAVGTGVLISLYSGLMSAVYSFVHFKFVNPRFADYQLELIRAKWVAAGMSDTQMDQAEKFTRMMMGPVVQAIMTPVFVVIFGLILSLVIAAFLKRAAPDELKAA